MIKIETIRIKDEVIIDITSQAQTVLKHTNYTVEDLKDWFKKSSIFSVGGNHVVLFLEHMDKEE